jgi:hypothetical protein
MNKSINNKQEKPTTFERIYEDEDCISIWRYDLNRTTKGPVEVEIKYKRGREPQSPNKKKTLKDHIATEKKNAKKKGP